MKRFTLFVLFVNTMLIGMANQRQQINIDSLFSEIKPDTTSVDLLDKLSYEICRISRDTGIILGEKSLEIATAIAYRNGIANAENTLGYINLIYCNYQKSMYYYKLALKDYRLLNNEKQQALILTNIAVIFKRISCYDSAAKYNFESLHLREKLKDTIGIAKTYNNLGGLYNRLKDQKKAYEYYLKSLNYAESGKSKILLGIVNSNLGYMSLEQNHLDTARYYLELAIPLLEEVNEKEQLVAAYNNLGLVFQNLNDFEKAREAFNKSYQLAVSINYTETMLDPLFNMAEIDLKTGQKEKALSAFLNLYKMASLYHNIYKLRQIAKMLSEIYSNRNDYKQAFFFQSEYLKINDSIFNSESMARINEMQIQYEVNKKDLEIKILFKENTLQDLKLKKSRTLVYAICAVLVVIVSSTFLLLRSFNKKKRLNKILIQRNNEINIQRIQIQKQNQNLENLNSELQLQKKEITHSIHYARRIQTAALPDSKLIKQLLPRSFVFYKPQSIVSGDFYWVNKINNKIIVAVADCTGHGVPAAFLSMLGIAFLNEIVNKEGTSELNKILYKLRAEIIQALKQEENSNSIKDGMEISICGFDFEKNKLDFAGASSSMFIIKNKDVEQGDIEEHNISEIDEIKGDNMPVSISDTMENFSYQSFKLSDIRAVYLSTDGFSDQFGGESRRKYNKRKFKELLCEISSKTVEDQELALEKAFALWKGNENQTDDVLVMGVMV